MCVQAPRSALPSKGIDRGTGSFHVTRAPSQGHAPHAAPQGHVPGAAPQAPAIPPDYGSVDDLELDSELEVSCSLHVWCCSQAISGIASMLVPNGNGEGRPRAQSSFSMKWSTLKSCSMCCRT